MINFTNKRKGKILFRCFTLPEELIILMTSENPEQIYKIIQEIKERGDVV